MQIQFFCVLPLPETIESWHDTSCYCKFLQSPLPSSLHFKNSKLQTDVEFIATSINIGDLMSFL